MTFSLSDRIAFHLAEEGRPATAEEIARALHARTNDVRQILEAESRFARTLPGRRSPKAKLYVVLAPTEAQDESGQAFSAYELDDPKHPTFHDRYADVWDSREKGVA